MNTIPLDSYAATSLREWLNENHNSYRKFPITNAQLCVWLEEAEQGQGVVEISRFNSVTGNPITFAVQS